MRYHNIYKSLYHNVSCLSEFESPEIWICSETRVGANLIPSIPFIDSVFFVRGLTLAWSYLVDSKCDPRTKRHIASRLQKSGVPYKISRIRVQEWRAKCRAKIKLFVLSIFFFRTYICHRVRTFDAEIRLNLIKYCWAMFNGSTFCSDKQFGPNRLEFDWLPDKGKWDRRRLVSFYLLLRTPYTNDVTIHIFICSLPTSFFLHLECNQWVTFNLFWDDGLCGYYKYKS